MGFSVCRAFITCSLSGLFAFVQLLNSSLGASNNWDFCYSSLSLVLNHCHASNLNGLFNHSSMASRVMPVLYLDFTIVCSNSCMQPVSTGLFNQRRSTSLKRRYKMITIFASKRAGLFNPPIYDPGQFCINAGLLDNASTCSP